MKFIYLILAMGIITNSSVAIPPWSNWHYSDEGCVSYGDNYVLVNLRNNTSFTMICNLTDNIDRGIHLKIKFNYSVSPQTILAGIKIILGNDVLLNMELMGHGIKDLSLSTEREYPQNSTFTIFIYSLGGSLSIKFNTISLSKSDRNFGQGLLISGLGISIVFFVLGILSMIMYILGYLSRVKKKVVKEEISQEQIAAITGAIAAYLHKKNVRIIDVKPSPQWKHGSLRRWRKWRR